MIRLTDISVLAVAEDSKLRLQLLYCLGPLSNKQHRSRGTRRPGILMSTSQASRAAQLQEIASDSGGGLDKLGSKLRTSAELPSFLVQRSLGVLQDLSAVTSRPGPRNGVHCIVVSGSNCQKTYEISGFGPPSRIVPIPSDMKVIISVHTPRYT